MRMTTTNRVIVNVRVDQTPKLLHTREETYRDDGYVTEHVITIADYPIVAYIEGTTDELRQFATALAALVDELDR